MMGVLPLTYVPGESAQSLGLSGAEHFDIPVPQDIRAGQRLTVTATNDAGQVTQFEVDVRLDTPVERGVLPQRSASCRPRSSS